jgi:hypothetical protein
MKNDYLWDGSGEPDPELQRIEKTLAKFGYAGEAPNFAALKAAPVKPSVFSALGSMWNLRFAAATVVVIALAASGFVLRNSISPVSNGPGWDVARLSGVPEVGQFALASDSRKTQLRVGQLLVTDSNSRASMTSAEVGEIYVDAGSRVRLIEAGLNRKRISLELGTIHAAIWAPPGEFVVDTPSASAVDLGCAYTLHVNEDGSGTLRTTLGWVGFHRDGHDSFIPAGAMCATRREQGPGTPYFEDASEEFRKALHGLDFETLSGEPRGQALRTVLAEARRRDAFTLWHLLSRVSDMERPLVYDRMAGLVQPPKGTTREGTLALEPKMLDAWWDAFDLGYISIWRFWEQQQAPQMMKKAAR